MFNMLTLTHLKKHFGGVKAVNGCSFNVKKNSITALIGPNGAGKTTAFDLISGLLKADAGKIILDGVDITKKAPHKRAALGISRTFQQVRLFSNLNLTENLSLSLNQSDGDFFKLFRSEPDNNLAIDAVLSAVGLSELPRNKRGAELSYGQTKLLGLARALLLPHKLLMLDEPVAGVNPVLREKLKEIIHSLKSEGETLLLIEHDMDFVMSVADTVIVMAQGRVIAEGAPSNIQQNDQVLEAYLGKELAV